MAIFSNGFEEGNFSAWTTVFSGSVVDTIQHHDTYSAYEFVPSYAGKTFDAQNSLFMRFYIRFSSFTGLSTEGELVNLGRLNFGTYPLVNLYCDEVGVRWALTQGANIVHVDVTPSLETWYCVEVKGVPGDESALYVDGSKIITNDAPTGTSNEAYIGCWDQIIIEGASSVAANFDCVVIDSSYIGPEGAGGGPTVKKGSSLSSTMAQMLNSKMLFSACNRFPKLSPRRF